MTNRPQTGRRYRTAAPARGKREQPASRRGDRHLRQLAVSGVVLLAVVLVKISAPAAMDKCRDKLLDLMGGQTDFRAAFSAVGRAVSGQGAVGQALNDAYTAVFGPQQTVPEGTADPAAYSAETTPGDVCLTQQVLGFAYANPLTGTVTDRFGYRQDPGGSGTRFHYGLDIAIFQIAVLLGFWVSWTVLRRRALAAPLWQVAGGAVLAAVWAAFIVWTFAPPELPLFVDPETGLRGIR